MKKIIIFTVVAAAVAVSSVYAFFKKNGRVKILAPLIAKVELF